MNKKLELRIYVAQSFQHPSNTHKALGPRLWFQFYFIAYSNNPTNCIPFYRQETGTDKKLSFLRPQSTLSNLPHPHERSQVYLQKRGVLPFLF